MSGYDGANGNHIILVRNPNYDQSTDHVPEELSGQFKFVVELERGRHLRQGAGRPVRRRGLEPRAEDDPPVRDGLRR